MRFSKLLAVLGLATGCALATYAQAGVYAMYSAQQLTNIKCLDPTGTCSSANGKVAPSGGWGGIYYDFKTLGPVRLGVDFRGGATHSNKSAVTSSGGDNATTATTFLGGVRATIHTPVSFLRPYVQGSFGVNRTDATETYQLAGSSVVKPYDNFLQYEAFAGLDLKIFPILDLRIAELGIGNSTRIGTGGAGSSNSMGVRSIGAGVVLHLP